MNLRLIVRLGLPAMVLVLVGCSGGFKLSSEYIATMPSMWPFHHGDAASAGVSPSRGYTGRLDVIWEKQAPGKASGPLTLHDGFLAVPSTKNRIILYDNETGRYLDKIKAKGPVQTGFMVSDSVGCFAVSPGGNRLSCIDLIRSEVLWQRRVKDASRGSIIVADRLLIGSSTGRLSAINLSDGTEAWAFCGEQERFTAPAAFGHGLVFQPGASGVLYAIAPEDGKERFRVKVEGPMVGGVAVADVVIGTDMPGHVYGISPTDGTLLWTTDIGGQIWTTPAVAGGLVFVGHAGGELVALRERDGQIVWRFRTVEVVTASASVVGQFVVVGTLGGNLYVLKAADGSIVSRRKVDGGIEVAPVSDGDRVYVATNRGSVICLGDRHEAAAAPEADQRVNSQYQSERAGAYDRPGTGDGVSEGGDIRPEPPDVAEGR